MLVQLSRTFALPVRQVPHGRSRETEHGSSTLHPRLAMDQIEATFNRMFAPWDIHLPAEALLPGRRGQIIRAGWAIWIRSGSDDRGTYLDY